MHRHGTADAPSLLTSYHHPPTGRPPRSHLAPLLRAHPRLPAGRKAGPSVASPPSICNLQSVICNPPSMLRLPLSNLTSPISDPPPSRGRSLPVSIRVHLWLPLPPAADPYLCPSASICGFPSLPRPIAPSVIPSRPVAPPGAEGLREGSRPARKAVGDGGATAGKHGGGIRGEGR